MKKLLIILTGFAFILSSCETMEVYTNPVDEYSYYQDNGTGFPEITTITQKFLIEKFTGQGCTNCPDASIGIKEAVAENSNLIPLSYYATFFSNPEYFQVSFKDLRADEGNEIADRYEIQGAPSVLLNRTNYNANNDLISAGAQTYSKDFYLNAASYIEENNDNKTAVQLKTQLFEDKYVIYAKMTFQKAFDDDVKFQLFILEDNIITPQMKHGEWIEDYKHDHVFRTSLNNTWGSEVPGDSITNGTCHKMFQLSKDLDMKYEDIKVLGVVYNAKNINSDDNNLNILNAEIIELQ